ncbi:MAG: hypothetical protein AAGA27_00425 [Pseudomonadota bacterium]
MKTKMIKLVGGSALLLLFAFTGSTLLAANNPTVSASTPSVHSQNIEQQKSWLLVLHAHQGKIEQRDDGMYLILNQVSEDMVAFTDRPDRDYKTVKTHNIVTNWQKLFAKDSGGDPNAVVTHAELTSMSGSVLPEGLILGKPQMAHNTVTFKVATLDQEKHSFEIGKTYKDINVFIDNVDWEVAL